MSEYESLVLLFEDAVRDAAWSDGVRQASANGTGLLFRAVRTEEAETSLRAAAAKAVRDFVTSPRICGPTLETHIYAVGTRAPHAQWWQLEYPAASVSPSALRADETYLTPQGVQHALADIQAEAQT